MDRTYQASPSMRKQKTLPQYFKHLKKYPQWRKQKILPRAWIKLINHHPHKGSRRPFLNSSSISSIIPIEEAEDSSPKYPKWRSRRFFPSESNTPKKKKKTSEEVEDSSSKSSVNHEGREDSSLVNHTSTLLLNESIHTTPQQVSHPQASHERQKIPPHEHLLLSEFSPSLVDLTIKATRAHITWELNMQAQ